MKYPKYDYSAEKELCYFEFTGIGIKGEIKKIVSFKKMNLGEVYNLAFGDYDAFTDSINDKIITNNGDSQKVLATVASTVYAFTGK